jgi:hypothetical protein
VKIARTIILLALLGIPAQAAMPWCARASNDLRSNPQGGGMERIRYPHHARAGGVAKRFDTLPGTRAWPAHLNFRITMVLREPETIVATTTTYDPPETARKTAVPPTTP